MKGRSLRRGRGSLVALRVAVSVALAGTARTAWADPVVTDGLRVFLDFEEGSGAVAHDRSGHGHDAVLTGGASLSGGAARVTGTGEIISVASARDLRGASFTYDVWFVTDRTTQGDGRLVSQSGRPGGIGPDVFERSGRFGIRVDDQGATIDPPTVGTRSSAAPPDHYGRTEDTFHRASGPEHFVLVVDGARRLARAYLGLEGQPLRLTFEATWTGSRDTSNEALTLGNHPSGEKPFSGRYLQFAYYDRALEGAIDRATRNVIGGDLAQNHRAGPSASLAASDAGVPLDAGVGACGPLSPREPVDPLVTLDVPLGSSTRVTFTFDRVPAPSGLRRATLALSLFDADHPGEEGTVYVNGRGPLALPANTAWTDRAGEATLDLPVSMLVAGTNTVAFGAGSRARTWYGVSARSLTLEGDACAPDAGPVDAGVAVDAPTTDLPPVDTEPRDVAAIDLGREVSLPTDHGSMSNDVSLDVSLDASPARDLGPREEAAPADGGPVQGGCGCSVPLSRAATGRGAGLAALLALALWRARSARARGRERPREPAQPA